MPEVRTFLITSYDVRLGVFIAFALAAAALFLYLFLKGPIRRYRAKRDIASAYFPKVYKTVLHGDYYLINDFERGEGASKVHIDHIIGGDKYIYVITDCYFDGAISGMGEDASWVYYSRKGKKQPIPNPLAANRHMLNRLSMVSGINSSFMVGVVLVNDECFVSRLDASNKSDSHLVGLKDLETLVEDYESRNVTPFVKKELWQAIHDLHELRKASKDERTS